MNNSLRTMMGAALALGASGLVAEIPEYDDPQLFARVGAGSAFEMPVGSSWVNSTPALNDQRQVGLEVGFVAPEEEAGIWLGDADGGEVVHLGSDELFGDPAINNDSVMVWRTAEGAQEGIKRYDPADGSTEFLTNAPLGASGWTSLALNSAGELGYRASIGFSGRAWVSWDDVDDDAIHLAEDGVDSNSEYAFLFSPSFNDDRVIAGKGAIGSFSTNQILTVTSDGTIEVLVEDAELDGDSPFDDFNNGVGFNNNGQVSFVGQLVGGGSGVYVADSDGWVQYAVEGEDGLADIEFFSTVINDAGLVAFRAFNDAGERAIWLADGDSVVQALTVGDAVDTDLGPALIGTTNDDPEFGGNVALNNAGDLAISANVVDAADPQQSFGRGLFVIPVATELPDPVFADRFESEDS